MAKHQTGTKFGAAVAAATARAVEPVAESAVLLSAPAYEVIARLAYQYWQERGCPDSSPEEDWFRAEADLQKQASKTTT